MTTDEPLHSVFLDVASDFKMRGVFTGAPIIERVKEPFTFPGLTGGLSPTVVTLFVCHTLRTPSTCPGYEALFYRQEMCVWLLTYLRSNHDLWLPELEVIAKVAACA